MPRISQASIEEVKSRADIVSVVGEYVKLTNRGSSYFGCCPFHNEKTPSFSVSPDKNLYYCFGCRASGTVVKFVEEIENLNFPEAIERLAEKFGVELRYEDGDYVPDKAELNKKDYKSLYTRVAGTFHYMLTRTEGGERALSYIRERGITDETIERFNLGYAPSDRHWLKKFLLSKDFSEEFLSQSGLFSRKYEDVAFFSNRFMFPIFDRRGDVVAFGGRILGEGEPKYLNSGDLPWYQKGETLFGFNFARQAIRQSKRAVFCEGYMDCIAYHQCGIQYAVAPLGTALTDSQIRLVEGMVDEILLSFDSDQAGQKATERAILMCRRHGIPVRVVHLEDGKDPAEIMKKFGKEYLTNAVNNSIFDFDHLSVSLTQKYPADSPEGKAKIAMELFDYVDALQSSIEKEATLDKIARGIGLPGSVVRSDFEKRERQEEPAVFVQKAPNSAGEAGVKPDAEFRALLAFVTEMDQFDSVLQAGLVPSDFSNPFARTLFQTLRDCREKGDVSLDAILSTCGDEEIRRKITESVVGGEYSGNPKLAEQFVSDSLRMMRKKGLLKQQAALLSEIQRLSSTAYVGEELLTLLEQKGVVDGKLNSGDF